MRPAGRSWAQLGDIAGCGAVGAELLVRADASFCPERLSSGRLHDVIQLCLWQKNSEEFPCVSVCVCGMATREWCCVLAGTFIFAGHMLSDRPRCLGYMLAYGTDTVGERHAFSKALPRHVHGTTDGMNSKRRPAGIMYTYPSSIANGQETTPNHTSRYGQVATGQLVKYFYEMYSDGKLSYQGRTPCIDSA